LRSVQPRRRREARRHISLRSFQAGLVIRRRKGLRV
jgi:hypothetical protein